MIRNSVKLFSPSSLAEHVKQSRHLEESSMMEYSSNIEFQTPRKLAKKKKHSKRKLDACEGAPEYINQEFAEQDNQTPLLDSCQNLPLNSVAEKKKKHKSKKREDENLAEIASPVLLDEPQGFMNLNHKKKHKSENADVQATTTVNKIKKKKKHKSHHDESNLEIVHSFEPLEPKNDEKKSETLEKNVCLPEKSKNKKHKMIVDKLEDQSSEEHQKLNQKSVPATNLHDRTIINSSDDFEGDSHISTPKKSHESSTTRKDRTMLKKRKKKSLENEVEHLDDHEDASTKDKDKIKQLDDDEELMEWVKKISNELYEEPLAFKPPELHVKYPSLKGLTAAQRQELSVSGIQFAYRKQWTKNEDKILHANMMKFIEKFRIPKIEYILGINIKGKFQPKVFNIIKQYLQFKKYSFFLGEGLNDRTLLSINKRIRIIFHPFKLEKRKKMDKSELQMLFRLQAKKGNNWATISEIMQKPGDNLFATARYHNEKKDSGPWTNEENEKLLEAVKRKMKLSSDGQSKPISWKKISKKVGTRTYSQCKEHWLHNLCWRFNHGDVERPRWTVDDTRKLICQLYQSDATNEREVDWEQLSEQFTNRSSYANLLKTWQQIKQRVPNFLDKDFQDQVLFLKEKYNE